MVFPVCSSFSLNSLDHQDIISFDDSQASILGIRRHLRGRDPQIRDVELGRDPWRKSNAALPLFRAFLMKIHSSFDAVERDSIPRGETLAKKHIRTLWNASPDVYRWISAFLYVHNRVFRAACLGGKIMAPSLCGGGCQPATMNSWILKSNAKLFKE